MSNGLPNSKPTTKAEQAKQRRSNTLQREVMYENRLKTFSSEIDELRGIISRQQIDFDEMFRKSEAMRNRQVDVINRLLKGGTMDEETLILMEENSKLQVEVADLRALLHITKPNKEKSA